MKFIHSIEGLDHYKTESGGKTHVQMYHNAIAHSPKWSAGRSKGALKSQGSWGGQADRRSPGSYKQSDRVGSPPLQAESFPTPSEVLSLHKVFQVLDTSIHLSTCCLMLAGVAFPSCIRCLVLLLSCVFWFHCCIFFLVTSWLLRTVSVCNAWLPGSYWFSWHLFPSLAHIFKAFIIAPHLNTTS